MNSNIMILFGMVLFLDTLLLGAIVDLYDLSIGTAIIIIGINIIGLKLIKRMEEFENV